MRTWAPDAPILVLTRPAEIEEPLPAGALLRVPLLSLRVRPRRAALLRQLERAAEAQLHIFLSAFAVRATRLLFPELAARARPGARWFAVGAATARALASQWQVNALAPTQADSEGLLALLGAVGGLRVAIYTAPGGRQWLAPQLRAAGAEVEEIEVYERRARVPGVRQCRQLRALAPRLVFAATSVALLEGVAALLPRLGLSAAQTPVIVASARIAAAATALGFIEVRVAAGADALALSSCITGSLLYPPRPMQIPESPGALAPDERRWLQPKLLDQIPLAQAMQLSITTITSDTVELGAPLAPNVNDKGCAFGGSIGALLTLAGWSLLMLKLKRAGLECGVYIQDSQLRYLKPAWSQLQALASVDPEIVERFINQFRQRGRARIEVCSVLSSDGIVAAEMQARYVALPLA